MPGVILNPNILCPGPIIRSCRPPKYAPPSIIDIRPIFCGCRRPICVDNMGYGIPSPDAHAPPPIEPIKPAALTVMRDSRFSYHPYPRVSPPDFSELPSQQTLACSRPNRLRDPQNPGPMLPRAGARSRPAGRIICQILAPLPASRSIDKPGQGLVPAPPISN